MTGPLVFIARSRTVLVWALPFVVLLAALSFLGQVLRLRSDLAIVHFLAAGMDVDRERAFPTWYQSVWLAACAAALWTVATAVHQRRERFEWAWRLLSVAFLGLSVDEFLSLHERANDPVRSLLDLGGALYFSWVVVAVPLLVLLVAVLVPFLRALPRRTLLAFLVAGAVYCSGTLGAEMVGASMYESGSDETVLGAVITTAEELLEMVGMTLFLAAVADHGERHLGFSSVGLAGTAARRGAGRAERVRR